MQKKRFLFSFVLFFFSFCLILNFFFWSSLFYSLGFFFFLWLLFFFGVLFFFFSQGRTPGGNGLMHSVNQVEIQVGLCVCVCVCVCDIFFSKAQNTINLNHNRISVKPSLLWGETQKAIFNGLGFYLFFFSIAFPPPSSFQKKKKWSSKTFCF